MADGVRRPTARRVLAIVSGALLLMLGAALFWRNDIERSLLDPGVPYQIYRPPPPPDYGRPGAWALAPRRPIVPAAVGDLDVFFVHGTTYKGGRDWNAPIGLPEADEALFRTMIPNYAGAFQRLGRVFAPRYRQASLYAFTTLRDDAREARMFALRDVEAALQAYLTRWNAGRPFVLVGVDQGGELLGRAVDALLAREPTVRNRIVAVYLIDVIAPADAHGPGAPLDACTRRAQAGCLVAWKQEPDTGQGAANTLLERALVWNAQGQLENLNGRAALCVDPISGAQNGVGDERANLGAANASGLEWGVRPAFLPRQVSTRCQGGLLQVSPPRSASLRLARAPLDRLRAPPFDLFYADLEADARARLAAFQGGAPAPPIVTRIDVRRAPVHRID